MKVQKSDKISGEKSIRKNTPVRGIEKYEPAAIWTWFGAAAIFLISLVTYLKTMAPTVSFWDAGEFIACSKILGIPHPPGTPFFVLLGRVFTMLPLGHETAWKVNFLSVLFSSAAAAFLYMTIREIAGKWILKGTPTGWLREMIASAGAATGSLALVFSDTYWFNATEAEVYGVSMFFMILITWLTLKWIDFEGRSGRGRLLLLIVYLSFLGVGIHMQTFMILFPFLGNPIVPILMLPMVLIFAGDRLKQKPYIIFTVLALPFILTAVIYSITLFAWLIVIGLVAGIITWVFSGRNDNQLLNATAALFTMSLLIAIVGYSPHVYIPLRSMENPSIDENDPETWERFKGFLERKQYGQESMLKLMFHRKGSFANQIGFHKNMGFLGFFCRQYTGKNLAMSLIPSFLGIVGIIALFSVEKKRAWYFFSFFLLVSMGLLLYLNFSDGTRGVKLEVRERDYFYTPAYFYFSFFIGIGVSWLIMAASLMGKTSKRLKTVPAVILSLAFVVSPAYSLHANYFIHDRSRNHIAYDYAYNILVSCEKDGIIFTNGDNDTFPLWFLQEVEGFRKDVRVVNLSLLNTHWYIHQLKDRDPKIEMGISDKEIDKLPMGVRTRSGDIVRLQDFMISHIIKFNSDRPIYFAITVPGSNRKGFDNRLLGEGFVYRVTYEDVGKSKVDGEICRKNLYEKYRYRGLADETIYKNVNTRNLLNNYSAVFMQLAGYYRNNGEVEKAIQTIRDGIEKAPPNHWQVYGLLAQYQYEGGHSDEALRTMRDCLDKIEEDGPDPYEFYVTLLLADSRQDDAVDALERGLSRFPDHTYFYQSLLKIYLSRNDIEKVMSVLQRWKSAVPDDPEVNRLLNKLKPESMKRTDTKLEKK